MTSQKDQIQSLIADIERALVLEKPRTPWIRASEVEPQRQALARAQNYLRSLQETFEAPGGWGPVDPSTGQIAVPKPKQAVPKQTAPEQTVPEQTVPEQTAKNFGGEEFSGIFGNRATSSLSSGESAENVLQALLTEMKFLKSSALEPLRLEMDSLRGERDRLYAEVRALAEQRQTDSLEPNGRMTVDEQQLNQFLQALMERLQANLSTQVTHTLSQLEADHAEAVAKLSAGADLELTPITTSAQLEEMRQLQSRSDQLLVNIDSTLQGMFETLQSNIDSYQISLNQGIENMQSLGRQGEVIVRSLVDHLTQQLGQSTPPEPAFFPPRSAALSEPEAFEAASSSELLAGELAEELASDPVGNFVEADPAETNFAEAETDTVFSLDDILPDPISDFDSDTEVTTSEDTEGTLETEDSTDAQPEDCIREDGTIDLDLLKLDIERSDEAQPYSPLADTEETDPEIEAGLVSTDDAAYLADLTFDDLTLDPALDEMDQPEPESPEIAFEPADDTELADVLPDLGALMSESLPPDTGSDTEPGTESAIAPELESEINLDLDLDPDLNLDVATGDIEPAAAIALPESALVPDIPDTDDPDTDDDQLSDDWQPNETEDTLPAELVAELEAASQDADRVAIETVDSELNALTSDLEEAVVFEAPAPPPETLSAASLPLESALIPDMPAGEAENVPTGEPGDFSEDGAEIPPEESETEGLQASQPQLMAAEARPDRPVEEPAALSEASADVPALADDPVGLSELLPIDAPPLPEPAIVAAEDSADQEIIDLFETTDHDLLPELPPTDEGEDDPTDGQPADWFLGIDIGTTGLSAVLMNQRGDQVYPLCWNMPGDDQSDRFRLPTVAQIDDQASPPLGAIGPAALQPAAPLLRNIKSLIKIGIPDGASGEPLVQWSDQVTLPLMAVQATLADLLKTLSGDRPRCRAVGLRDSALRSALMDLRGVIVGYPNNWPDTYSFNIREAVLAAGLVQQAEQIFFVEEAIAALLSALPDPRVADDLPEDQQPGLYNCHWSGGTVILSAGAALTEAAMVDLPAELDQLSYADFTLRSFAYGGDNLDQDIVCQLLHLPAQARLEAPQQTDTDETAVNTWQALGLHRLNLPQPGEADRIKRHRLQQRLNGSPLGRQALAAARRLKLDLQEEDQTELGLADQRWVIKRKDLETKVFLPYIQRVNRQINGLLSQQGLSPQAVNQVVCTGGTASLGAIARWLRQKFPNATIIQDTYSGEYSDSCSRVAYGLANLCHYPQVLDTHRHQYSDYFLLLELLRVLPEQPLPAGGILHLLEQRGINTQVCQSHILALIEGHLPPGLVPTEGDRPWISAQSSEIGTYQMLAELPLFKKQGGQIYIADPQQGDRLRTHLETILADKAQTLKEPLTAPLAPETA